jgi:uncharacterized protein (DUF1697 family)
MRYVALLRGINVGGKNKVSMERLREIAAALGFANVKTYVNSGNMAFDTKKSDDRKLAVKIHDALEHELGLDLSVMVRSAEEIADVVTKNPYLGQFDNHKDVHVFFLDRELSKEEKALLMALANDKEMITLNGRAVYCFLKISILDSALGKGFIDRKLKVPATARNWRTVEALVKL